MIKNKIIVIQVYESIGSIPIDFYLFIFYNKSSVSEYDHELPQSQTLEQPTKPYGFLKFSFQEYV